MKYYLIFLMGVRSFLIRFESTKDIRNFIKYRRYLAYKVFNNYNDETKEDNDFVFDRDEANIFNESNQYENYGDYDINLVGFKFWAGSVWGLISTYSAGETTFFKYIDIFKNFNTRLWDIPTHELGYNKIKPVILNVFNDLKESIKVFMELYVENITLVKDYEQIFNTHQKLLDKYKSIDFHNKQIQVFLIN
jgi:hypothetical protein